MPVRVIADPAKKKAYSHKKHASAYHAAIADYINTSKAEERGKAITAAEEKPVSTATKIQEVVMPPMKTRALPLRPAPTDQAPS